MLANALAALAAHSIVGSNLGTARRDIATIALQAESDDTPRVGCHTGSGDLPAPRVIIIEIDIVIYYGRPGRRRSGSRMWTSGFLPGGNGRELRLMRRRRPDLGIPRPE
jgi:hypothetical protein